MSRAFLICPEPVRAVTAGVGTRFMTLAKVLAEAGHQVTLAVPNEVSEAPSLDGVEVVRADPASLGDQADGHDWVLLHAHLGNHYLTQRDDLPLVIDLYDPFLIENLHYHRDLGFTPFETDHETWRLQIGRGDLFLCSSEEQRLFYLGWLSALGRVNPLTLEDDPQLRRLIVEVPFGTPERGPIDDDAPVLYFGGIYEWYEPMTALDAMPPLLERDPRTVLVFVEHPHPELTPMEQSQRVKDAAAKRGWLGSTVRFEQWRPYDRRFEIPQVSDLAVVTHRPGLETDLSLRTRLVDLLWLGLPAVVTAGGTMARVMVEHGAGLVVPPGDSDALASAVAEMLDDGEKRRTASKAGQRWAADRRWAVAAQPLLEFAEKPWRDRHRVRFSELAPDSITAEEPLLQKLQRALRRKRGGR
jgi:glycosyltransferase involved in cell wall biosynthesis